jgi:hypothetical protein
MLGSFRCSVSGQNAAGIFLVFDKALDHGDALSTGAADDENFGDVLGSHVFVCKKNWE